MKKINQHKTLYRIRKLKKGLDRNKDKVKVYEVFLLWLRSRLSRNQFLILSGILVGCSAGLAGVLLKILVHYIHYLITQKLVLEQQLIFYFIFPLLGIVLTVLVVLTFFNGQDRKGIPAILYEIAQNSSLVSSVKMYSQIVQSAITVGLGGSVGVESPIAVTGSAIGSNFARTYHLDYKDRTLLLAAGATAGIASAFNAPIAGMMFAFEILLTGVIFSDFIPLIVAAICGSLMSKIILNEEALFQFHSRDAFNYLHIPLYVALAIVSGFYARYFVLISQWVEHWFKALAVTRLQKAVIGGVCLSILCCLFPPLFGEGYQTIKDLVSGKEQSIIGSSFFHYFDYRSWFILVFLGLVCLLKAFATSITIFSGGNGGSFGPSLFAGGIVGYVMAMLATLTGIDHVPTSNMVIVGMAGVMSGVLYAPLTAIFLIAESSSGYDLFIPLMIVSVISFLIVKRFSTISPDLKVLADQGKIFTREHDHNLLSLISISALIEKDVQSIDVSSTFSELIDLIKHGKHNFIAVINHEQNLEGILTMDDMRPFIFEKEQYGSLNIREIMIMPLAIVHRDDDMREIIKKFDETETWYLPVVDHGKFVGFISKSKILNEYRKILKAYS